MQAKNQDLEFVNDTLVNAKNTTPVNIMEDDLHLAKKAGEQHDKEKIQG